MKYIIAVLFSICFMATNAFAADCNIKGDYPNEVLAAMTKACKDSIAANSILPQTVDQATQWGIVAKEFAAAIGIAAREIGVSVNEFVASPAGYITVGIILWKVIGTSIAKYLLLFTIWAIALRVIRVIWTQGYEEREYKNIFNQQKSKRVRKYYCWDDVADSQVGMCVCTMGASAILSIILLANM